MLYFVVDGIGKRKKQQHVEYMFVTVKDVKHISDISSCKDNLPLLDISKVTLDSKLSVESYHVKYSDSKSKFLLPPHLIFDDDLILEYRGVLGSGGYGMVCVYAHESRNDVQVALKVVRNEDGEDDPDVIVIKRISDIVGCDMVSARYLGDRKMKNQEIFQYIVMPVLNFTLDSMLSVIESQDKDGQVRLAIAESVIEAVDCLEKKGAYYVDLKPDNILLHCLGNGHMQVLLGDFGSIIFKDDTDRDYPSTYEVIAGDDNLYEDEYKYQLVTSGCLNLLLMLFCTSWHKRKQMIKEMENKKYPLPLFSIYRSIIDVEKQHVPHIHGLLVKLFFDPKNGYLKSNRKYNKKCRISWIRKILKEFKLKKIKR